MSSLLWLLMRERDASERRLDVRQPSLPTEIDWKTFRIFLPSTWKFLRWKLNQRWFPRRHGASSWQAQIFVSRITSWLDNILANFAFVNSGAIQCSSNGSNFALPPSRELLRQENQIQQSNITINLCKIWYSLDRWAVHQVFHVSATGLELHWLDPWFRSVKVLR